MSKNQRLPLGEVPMNEMNNRLNPEESIRDSKEMTHVQSEDKMDFGNDFKSFSKRIGKKTMPYGSDRTLNAYKTQSK